MSEKFRIPDFDPEIGTPYCYACNEDFVNGQIVNVLELPIESMNALTLLARDEFDSFGVYVCDKCVDKPDTPRKCVAAMKKISRGEDPDVGHMVDVQTLPPDE